MVPHEDMKEEEKPSEGFVRRVTLRIRGTDSLSNSTSNNEKIVCQSDTFGGAESATASTISEDASLDLDCNCEECQGLVEKAPAVPILTGRKKEREMKTEMDRDTHLILPTFKNKQEYQDSLQGAIYDEEATTKEKEEMKAKEEEKEELKEKEKIIGKVRDETIMKKEECEANNEVGGDGYEVKDKNNLSTVDSNVNSGGSGDRCSNVKSDSGWKPKSFNEAVFDSVVGELSEDSTRQKQSKVGRQTHLGTSTGIYEAVIKFTGLDRSLKPMHIGSQAQCYPGYNTETPLPPIFSTSHTHIGSQAQVDPCYNTHTHLPPIFTTSHTYKCSQAQGYHRYKTHTPLPSVCTTSDTHIGSQAQGYPRSNTHTPLPLISITSHTHIDSQAQGYPRSNTHTPLPSISSSSHTQIGSQAQGYPRSNTHTPLPPIFTTSYQQTRCGSGDGL